jgi:translation initiation factor 5
MTEPIRGNDEIIDPSYRYQMTPIDVVKEKTKICITNLDQIARDLRLPNKDPIVAYIGKRLSVKTKVEHVKTRGGTCDRVILAGNMDLQLISETIYPFIETFVLCPTCKLPELKYSVKKNLLYGRCSACSFRGELQGDKHGSTTIKKFAQILGSKNRDKKTKRASKNRDKSKDKSKGRAEEGDSAPKQERSRLDILLEQEESEQRMIDGFS